MADNQTESKNGAQADEAQEEGARLTTRRAVPPAGPSPEQMQLMSEYERSLDAIATGGSHLSYELAMDAYEGILALDFDLPEGSRERFEAILADVNARLLVSVDYRRSYADDVFGNIARDMAKILAPSERSSLAHIRQLAKENGPDSAKVRVLVGFSYPTPGQLALQTALDTEVWAYIQSKADEIGPAHPRIRSLLTTASSAQAGTAMAAALDEKIWRTAQRTAAELGPEHPQTRALLAAASSEQAKAAMAAALDHEVWSAVQAAVKELGLTHFRVRQILSAASMPEVAEVMLGLLYRLEEVEPKVAGRFFADRKSRYIEKLTREAADSDARAEWLTREDPETIGNVISTIRRLRREAAEKGETMADAAIYVAFRREADYGDIHHETGVRADRTRPFQIVAALMGGSRSGKLPF